MTKKILYSFVMLAGFISCTDDYKDWSGEQANPQEETKSVTLEVIGAADVDYAVLDSSLVQIFKPTITAVDECSTTYQVTLWNEGKSANGTLAANDSGYVVADELKAVVENLYGKHPVARKLLLDIVGYSLINGQSIKTTAEDSVNVTLEAPHFGEFIYEIGNESGWGTSHALRGPNFDGKYQGYYWMDGEYKFKPNADNWDGDWENDGEGKIADNGGSNMPGLAAGFYQIDVDLAAMTYAATLVESISIIGSANGNWDTDTDLTYNQATGAWEVTTTLNAGEIKFRMNHDWAISWGGANGDGTNYGDLTQNGGANLQVAAGTYLVQLYIQHEGANKVVLTAQ